MPKKTAITKAPKQNLAPIYDTAAKKVNGLLESTAKNLAEVGDYLLKTFFENDVDAAKNKSSKKGLSLRRLSTHPDIDCSYSTLSRALDVSITKKELGTVAALQQLSASHLVTLSGLKTNTDKMRYAKMVAAENLSSRKLRERLVADGVKSLRGRGAIDQEWKKELAGYGMLGYYKAFKALGDVEGWDPSDMDVRSARRTLEEAEAARKSIDDLIGKLRTKVG